MFPDGHTKVAILEYDIGVSADNFFAKLNSLMEKQQQQQQTPVNSRNLSSSTKSFRKKSE